MKKTFITILLALLYSFSALAQDAEPVFEEKENENELKKPKKKLSEKFTFGGGFGFSFGTYTRVALSPIVGYRATERILLGVEGRYAYVKDFYNGFQTNYYSFGPFSRVIVYKGIYFQAQAEFMNYDEILFTSYNSRRVWNTAMFLGAGYRQAIGERAFSFVTVLWDINETTRSFYETPIIRFGITF